MMDKSPLKTLTLEDFLEASRQKLTGALTPVTAETFAKWKKDRLDKKAAEDEARKAKEATGRAMFEKGDWRFEEEEEDSDDGDDDDDNGHAENDDNHDRDVWNLEALRRETEEAGERRERERIREVNGVGGGDKNGIVHHDADADADADDDDGDRDGKPAAIDHLVNGESSIGRR